MWQNALFCNVEESIKKILDPDPKIGKRMTSKVLISSSKSFMIEDPFSSFYVKLITDKQTDKCRALHNLLGAGSNQTD